LENMHPSLKNIKEPQNFNPGKKKKIKDYKRSNKISVIQNEIPMYDIQ